MSLEKEPAGAFNKAQRLNERTYVIPHNPYLQGLAKAYLHEGPVELPPV